MRRLIPLLIAPLLLSCGYVSRSTVHQRSDWQAFEKDRNHPLPPVTLEIGKTTLAYKHRIGFPPMFGGYIPSLLAADPSLIQANLVTRDWGSDTYLTGVRPGKTMVYLVNGMANPKYLRENLDQNTPGFVIEVKE